MSNEELDLLTDFNQICLDVEILAIKNLHTVELPLCGFLTSLSAKDCVILLKHMLHNSKSINPPSMETILLNYFITDYISCGFSSQTFHTIFHKNLQTDDAKTLLIKLLIRVWNYVFEHYEITSLNVEFVKDFVVSLERVFIKITNLVPECLILFQKINVIDKIKKRIAKYERKSTITKFKGVENEVNIKLNTPIIKLYIENQVPQTEEKNQMENMKCLSINNEQQKRKVEPFSNQHNLLKKPKLIYNNDLKNVLNHSTKSDPNKISIKPADQKLNIFQIMMLNAKKQKNIIK